MRLNIEWKAPWMHGKPIKTWFWHRWYMPKGIFREKSSFGCTLVGFYIQVTFDSIWSGITLSVHLYDHEKE